MPAPFRSCEAGHYYHYYHYDILFAFGRPQHTVAFQRGLCAAVCHQKLATPKMKIHHHETHKTMMVCGATCVRTQRFELHHLCRVICEEVLCSAFSARFLRRTSLKLTGQRVQFDTFCTGHTGHQSRAIVPSVHRIITIVMCFVRFDTFARGGGSQKPLPCGSYNCSDVFN